jgi:Phytanoyl-CoA dioxygenase (PhyH)
MCFNVEQHGFATVADVIDATTRDELIAQIGQISGAGRRGLLALPAIEKLARSARILGLTRPHLASEPVPVRAIYFDKSPEANWLVAWHQDMTIAVRARADVPGFGPWSVKDGIPHVQPPVELLEQMLAVRIHLDDSDSSNGALRVLPRSHCAGRMSQEQIEAFRSRSSETICVAKAGDALLMRPLLLHASSRSSSSAHRRVVHIEYAGFELPDRLQWHDAA